MITLAYLDKHKYTKEQLLTLHLLFSNNVIALYSENHPKDYPLALEYFKTKKVYDLCDYEVYPNGVGIQYEKIINFDVDKPEDIQITYSGCDKADELPGNPDSWHLENDEQFKSLINPYPNQNDLQWQQEQEQYIK